MNDQLRWDRAGKKVLESYERLPDHSRESLAALVDRIMQLKEELAEISLAAGSDRSCSGCGGECCSYGKYHFSVMDLIAFIVRSIRPPDPVFDNRPFCPYSNAAGCMMISGFRPVTCVIFNCELIDRKICGADREGFSRREQLLREAVSQADLIINMRAGRPLLLSSE